jgi:hypothetical protein
MKNKIRISDSELVKIINKVLKEDKNVEHANYMFFANLSKIIEKCEELLSMDKDLIDVILEKGHDWADDHLSSAAENIDQVYEFLKGEVDKKSEYVDYEDVDDMKALKESNLNFFNGKPISLIRRRINTKFNINTNKIEKVFEDEIIEGRIIEESKNNITSKPFLKVKYSTGNLDKTTSIFFNSETGKYVDVNSVNKYEFMPLNETDSKILKVFKNIQSKFDDINLINEGRKKSGTKLCARGKSAAKAKFKVYPSAYANGYGVQVCKGKKPGLDGKKRCSPPYC